MTHASLKVECIIAFYVVVQILWLTCDTQYYDFGRIMHSNSYNYQQDYDENGDHCTSRSDPSISFSSG